MRRSLLHRLPALAALGLAVGATGFVVERSLEGERAQAASVPPCDQVNTRTPARRVTCTTGRTTLTVAPEGKPLVLPGTDVRVLRSRVEDDLLRVTLRIRNESAGTVRAPTGRGQLYVSAGGKRRELRSTTTRAHDDGTTTLVARFRVPEDLEKADLGVVPWPLLGENDPRQLGVVRLVPAASSR